MAGEEVPRISSGTPYLDATLAGGWLRGGTYIIAGPPGSGKTTLGNQFRFSVAERGECALYVTLLAETHSRMMLHLRSMTFFRQELVGNHVFYVSGTSVLKDNGLHGFLELLTRTVREKHNKALVIDGASLIRERSEQTNTLFGPDLHSPFKGAEATFDNLLFLRIVELNGRLRRLLSILKMRDSDNDPFLREFIITHRGLQVGEAYAALEGMLTGLPTLRRQHSGQEGAGPPGPPRSKASVPKCKPGRRPRKPGGRA